MKRLVLAVAVLLCASVASAQYPGGMQYRGWSPAYGYMYHYEPQSYYQPRIRAETYHYGNRSETTIQMRPSYHYRPAWGSYGYSPYNYSLYGW